MIGDFTWTGWDYLGEAGIGRTVYSEPEHDAGDPVLHWATYPWRTAWCGDIDITGHRRPQSYYREIVFGLRTDPYVAVQRPEHHGKVAAGTPWSWSDVVSSWSWAGHEGAPVTVEVYADADEVELVVNGRSLGRQPSGRAAPLHVPASRPSYEPGLLEAVAWRDGRGVGRIAVRSAAGPVLLDATRRPRRDRAPTPGPGLRDAHTGRRRRACCTAPPTARVDVEVDGPGVLQALGSANPATRGGLHRVECTTFDGRALAVVRPTGRGRITLPVTADGCASASRSSIDARGRERRSGRRSMTWELRWHPFRGQWVLFTSHRDARPWIGEVVAPDEPPVPDDNALAPLGTTAARDEPGLPGRLRLHQRPPGVLARRAGARIRRRASTGPAARPARRRWSATTTTPPGPWPTSTTTRWPPSSPRGVSARGRCRRKTAWRTS